MHTLFLQYGGHLCLAIILTGLAILAVCYWTPKYFRCSRCRCDFKPSRPQRAARLVASDLPMTCPACQNATDVLDRNREWPEPADDFSPCRCEACRVERMQLFQRNLLRAAEGKPERKGGAINSSRLGCALLVVAGIWSAQAGELQTLGIRRNSDDKVDMVRWTVPQKVSEVKTNTINATLEGRFWTEWIIETNDTPRQAMVGFDNVSQGTMWISGQNIYWGNYTNAGITGFAFHCDKEHVDRSEHQDISYVSSNLVSFLVWRGQTNRHYLESIPITNIVKRWRYEQVKTYIK